MLLEQSRPHAPTSGAPTPHRAPSDQPQRLHHPQLKQNSKPPSNVDQNLSKKDLHGVALNQTKDIDGEVKDNGRQSVNVGWSRR